MKGIAKRLAAQNTRELRETLSALLGCDLEEHEREAFSGMLHRYDSGTLRTFSGPQQHWIVGAAAKYQPGNAGTNDVSEGRVEGASEPMDDRSFGPKALAPPGRKVTELPAERGR